MVSRTCEICQSVARNVVGPNDIEFTEQLSEANSASTTAAVSAPGPSTDTQSFWHGHRFLNFLLACMVGCLQAETGMIIGGVISFRQPR